MDQGDRVVGINGEIHLFLSLRSAIRIRNQVDYCNKNQESYDVFVMAKTQRKKDWGGKRPGAGRPGEGRVTVCTRIQVEVAQRLRLAAKKQNTTLSRLIAELLSTDERLRRYAA